MRMHFRSKSAPTYMRINGCLLNYYDTRYLS